MTTVPKAPEGARAAGRRLWRAVMADYVLAEHELILLRQAVRTADTCDALQVVVDSDGPMLAGKVHPALVELRQQRLTLARLVVALRVPMAEDDASAAGPGRGQRRGLRGVYGLRGGAA